MLNIGVVTKMVINEKYPIVIGVEYIHTDGTIGILQSCDMNLDVISIKDPNTPWYFISNYSTFQFYWKIK